MVKWSIQDGPVHSFVMAVFAGRLKDELLGVGLRASIECVTGTRASGNQ